MNVEVVKAVADAVRSVMILSVVILVLMLYGAKIGNLFDRLTELSYGGTKLSFSARLELLKRSARSGVTASETDEKIAIQRAEKHKSDLQGMRTLWVNDHPSEDRRLRDLLEDYGVRSDVVRGTEAAILRLEETRYDAVVTDEYRGGREEAVALAKRMIKLTDGSSEVPLIIYGANSGGPLPQGVQLRTNRPDEVLNKIIDLAVLQASRVQAGAAR